MTRILAILMLASPLLGCGEDVQLRLATVVHYDDFSGSAIDLTRWSVDVTGDGVTGSATQAVAGGSATLDLTAVSGDIQSSLLFPVPLVGSIGSIAAQVKPVAYSEGPGSNVRFRLFIRPYKDDKFVSAPAPDLTSDIFAQLRVRAGQFQAMVSRCLDAGCGSEVIFGATVLGSVTLGVRYDLALQWDGNTGFWFDVAGVGSAYFDASEGLYAKVAPSGSPRAKLEVIATSGAPTTGTAAAELNYVDCARWNGDLC